MQVFTPSDTLKEEIASLRSQLVSHPLYAKIEDIAHIKTFMANHVFAVWDFMSLLKSLQKNLTCVSTPWLPVKDANTSYLINEIVLGEESDVDEIGNRTSHFQLYLKAMDQVGAKYVLLTQLLKEIENGTDVHEAIASLNSSEAVKNFLNFTFKLVKENKTHVLAAVFTYGREDLIPDMFLSIVKDLEQKFPLQLSTFKYYLERHIEVDGEHHSKLAYEMTDSLCTTSMHWQEATEAVKEALTLRVKLWDAISSEIS